MRSVYIVIAILALSSIDCGEAAKKRKKFEGDFEFADDAVVISSFFCKKLFAKSVSATNCKILFAKHSHKSNIDHFLFRLLLSRWRQHVWEKFSSYEN